MAVLRKVHALANLMKADGRIADRELEYLDALLTNSNPPEICAALRETFEAQAQQPVKFEVFKGDEDERLALMMDLVALARRDGELHPVERVYIRQVAALVEFPEADVELLTA